MKNIVVFGTGGVGGYFGGKLAYYFQNDREQSAHVYFIARGEHLKAIQENGLILDSSEGTFKCRPESAAESIEKLPKPDIVLLCVKSYDLENAAREIKKTADEKTVILPLLNGVDIVERIRKDLKKGIILPACVYVGTHIEKPGVVLQRGGDARILFGTDPLHNNYQAGDVKEILDKAGIHYQWLTDPYPAIWEKYLFVTSYGLVTAYSGKTIGGVYNDPELKLLTQSIILEIKLIADKKGIKLDPDIIEKTLEKARSFPFETRTSYQRDVETRGRKNEGDLFGGAVIIMGKKYAVPVPKTEFVYNKIVDNIH